MSISKEIMLEMYKRMDQVRKFEEKVSEFFAKVFRSRLRTGEIRNRFVPMRCLVRRIRPV